MMPGMSIRPNGGWILYDGRCPLCRGGARKLGGVAKRLGFRLAPLQRAWVRQRLAMEETELLKESRVLTPDGRLIGGATMYVHLSRRVWWAWPVAAIAAIPGGMRLLDWVYARVARHRYCISRACGLGTRRRSDSTTHRAIRGLASLFDL